MKSLYALTLIFLCLSACGDTDHRAPTQLTEPPPVDVDAPSEEQPVMDADLETTWRPRARPTMADDVARELARDAQYFRDQGALSGDWGRYERAAASLMGRARITGDWGDWDHALGDLVSAHRIAPETSGPQLTSASIAFALHRFGEAEARLDVAQQRLLLPSTERAVIEAMRADLAFHSGDLAQALEGYELAHALYPSPSTSVRQGVHAFKRGDLEGARRWLDEAVTRAEREDEMTLAWALLQRGIVELDSGHWEQARAWFVQADEAFPGWFLIEEHIAEVTGLLGQWPEALARYQDIAARVPLGEFQDALAGAWEALGRADEAARWRAQAAQTFERDVARYPQAVYGHGLDFFLAGEDTARALELARANWELRPGCEAGVKLAQAYVRVSRLDQAAERVEACLTTAWSTADLHATAYVIYTIEGQRERAEEQRALAIARHPHAIEDIRWLLPE